MDTKKLIFGTVAGGVVAFLLGGLVYTVILAGFFESHLGSAQGAMKDPPDMLWIAIGNLFGALLLTIIYGRWAGIKTIATGAKAGAVFGLLVALYYDSVMFGTTNLIGDPVAIVVDSIANAVCFAGAGAAIGWILGRE